MRREHSEMKIQNECEDSKLSKEGNWVTWGRWGSLVNYFPIPLSFSELALFCILIMEESTWFSLLIADWTRSGCMIQTWPINFFPLEDWGRDPGMLCKLRWGWKRRGRWNCLGSYYLSRSWRNKALNFTEGWIKKMNKEKQRQETTESGER